jgi:hypothetical protein
MQDNSIFRLLSSLRGVYLAILECAPELGICCLAMEYCHYGLDFASGDDISVLLCLGV